MARKYEKKSSYWIERKNKIAEPTQARVEQNENAFGAEFAGETHFSASAACGGGTGSRTFRSDPAPSLRTTDRYQNIRDGIVPFEESGGLQNITAALDAVYRAYFNVQILRNCINMMVDFSSSKIHVRTSNKAVKKFYEDWFEVIGLNKFQAEYFMERCRGGNVFVLKFNGKIEDKNFGKLKETFGAKKNILPIRYIILNPMQVGLQLGAGLSKNYVKILSRFEVERLKNPRTPEDEQILKSLPPEEQQRIKQSNGVDQVWISLDPNRLIYSFFKKQGYEPFAIPPTYGILNDIEWKLELKKMDLALSRTIEQVILLVTTGDKADEYNKGLNQKHLEQLKAIFKNQTIGRVLVADYTTKAQWVIPDLKELLGPQKYERVDQDIKEGLQYMFFGDEKFANATIKVKVFMETLKEGQTAFLEDFLKPEAKKIAESMNFKNIPEFEFEEVNLQDEAVMNRIYVQMAQLGLLTPDELNQALLTGILPTKDISEINQKEYKTQRKQEMYVPLVGGPKDQQAQSGRPSGAKAPQTTKKVAPIGTKASQFSTMEIVKNLAGLQKIEEALEKNAKRKWKVKELNESQSIALGALAKSIIINEKEEDYVACAKTYLSEPKSIDNEISSQIDEISIEHDVDNSIATILYKSLLETGV